MKKSEPSATILLYHGVTASSSKGIENFSKKHMPVNEFEDQMAYLRDNTTLLTLRDLTTYLNGKKSLPHNSVAVTFDDSYKNVHDIALPVLKRYQIPATFFVSTGFIGNNRRFWTDKVEDFINLTHERYVEIPIENILTTYKLDTHENKLEATMKIKSELKRLLPNERDEVLSLLRLCAGVVDNGDDVPNYRNLTANDLYNLDDPPFYEVGGHGVNHEILSLLSGDELQFEVDGCIQFLEESLGHKIDLYSYPEGQSEDFNEKVIKVLKYAGISICPTAIRELNYLGTEPFYLKRIMVGFLGEKFPFSSFISVGQIQ